LKLRNWLVLTDFAIRIIVLWPLAQIMVSSSQSVTIGAIYCQSHRPVMTAAPGKRDWDSVSEI
jgi:hypothetical protein